MNVKSLSLPLPEDILKRKWAGDLSGAIAAIDLRLAEELPRMLRERLCLEREILLRLPTQYPYDQAQALAKMRELVPDFTLEELARLELQGKVDFLYIEGEKRYFVRFHRTLLKTHREIMARAGRPLQPSSALLDPLIARMKREGSLAARITLRGEMRLEDEAFLPGETYLAHLPLPIPGAAQSQIQLGEMSPRPLSIAPEDAPARTACFRETLAENRSFCVEYRYVSRMVYADLTRPAPAQPLYPAAAAPTAQDLAEEEPFLRFTPYLRWLAEELRGDETRPVQVARRFYDFVTTRVQYAFVRDYFQIDHLGEYAAVNLKGDCGLQALLFILLCRISGIPARWQSGLSIDPDYVGSHDWAQFWLEGWGWLFCDCSFGGAAWRAGNRERWDFYFGNLEPLRMAANRRFAGEFDVPKAHLRIDPYDNQSGELECSARGFNGRQVDTEYSLKELTYI